MTSCVQHHYLYIYISDCDNCCIYRLRSNENYLPVSAVSWSLRDKPCGLSLTPNNNLLVTCRDSQQLLELCSDGRLVRRIELQWGPSHAVQLTDQRYVVSHGEAEVSILNVAGYVSTSYGRNTGGLSQPSRPRHITCDRDNFICVADVNNSRIMLFSSSLQFICSIELDGRPVRLYFDRMTQRLYIGLDNSQVTMVRGEYPPGD